jgi:cytochrome c oxidase subunit 2
VKLDAVPGITTTIRVTPTRLGSYPAECTELCGAGHSLMRAAVRVATPQAFRTWLQSQPANAPPPIGTPPPNAAQPGVPGAGAPSGGGAPPAPAPGGSGSTTSQAPGKAVFTGSAGCSTCHTLAAAGATGTIGPDLGVRLVPDAKKAGLPLKQFILQSITAPNKFIAPGFQPNIMPPNFAQKLTPAQIQELVNFIAGVTK